MLQQNQYIGKRKKPLMISADLNSNTLKDATVVGHYLPRPREDTTTE
jgi:hypothetical protein